MTISASIINSVFNSLPSPFHFSLFLVLVWVAQEPLCHILQETEMHPTWCKVRYAIQHQGFAPVARIEGCYASIMGLSLGHLARALAGMGATVPLHVAQACAAAIGAPCCLSGGNSRSMCAAWRSASAKARTVVS